jgi:8-amino-7-oxononanoate synthase
MWAIDYLIQRARPFVFSTAPTPAIADAIEASLDVIEQEPDRRERLLVRARYLRAALSSAGVQVERGMSQIVPVIVGDNDRAVAIAAALQADGFDVRAIRPPSVPSGTARLRISVNAAIAEETLDWFVARLAAEICCAVSS